MEPFKRLSGETNRELADSIRDMIEKRDADVEQEVNGMNTVSFGGGALFVDSGDLKFRKPDGTIVTITVS